MEKKRIGVVTATRAEYGLLKNVMREINKDEELELVLFVTGTHLSRDYGYTVDEIINDGFVINEKIDILMKDDSPSGICKTMGMASILFGEAFSRNRVDILVVLGDRYELLPICQTAMCFRIPIAHISGGETTEGVIDEAVRHCVTKMSYLHFPSCEEYRKRVIQLGEYPDRVFNFGDVGVENSLTTKLYSKKELEDNMKISLESGYFSVTFHPVTLENESAEEQICELLDALVYFDQYKFIITKSNADVGNQIINKKIDEYVEKYDNLYAFESLGNIRYLSLVKFSCGVIGNSSSGIIEAPVFGVPTVNIGDRQRGRLKASSIIDCAPQKNEIISAIMLATSDKFLAEKCDGTSPYDKGKTAKQIVHIIKDNLFANKIDLKKTFYDLP